MSPKIHMGRLKSAVNGGHEDLETGRPRRRAARPRSSLPRGGSARLKGTSAFSVLSEEHTLSLPCLCGLESATVRNTAMPAF